MQEYAKVMLLDGCYFVLKVSARNEVQTSPKILNTEEK